MEQKQPEKEFNLLDEPWILVKTRTGEVKEWSLLEVFQHAHEAQQLAGELPTQDIAVMRLLLAIMHGAFITSDIDDDEMAIACWKEMWAEKKFMYEIVAEYLEQYRERFWLFHPQSPFYQVANLKSAMDEYRIKNVKGYKVKEEEKLKTVARLIGDLFQSDHGLRLFPPRTGEEQGNLDYAEAARWLLHLNGYDDDSAKKPTPKGVGYLGQLGLVYAQGCNLFETLMLNFVLLDDRNEVFADHEVSSRAYWEKPVCTIIENLIVQPRAQKDLLTMQSRRILLKRTGGKVIGYLSTMGDYFDKDQPLINETMTLWGADDKKGIIPKRHKPDRQLWRDFPVLLCEGGNSQNREAGVVHWLRFLEENGSLSTADIKLCVVGVYYKLKGAGWQIVDYIQDSLQINSFLFRELGKQWVEEISRVLGMTDKAVSALGWLSADIAAADGNSNKDYRTAVAQRTREDGYHLLDGIFRNWLFSIDASGNDPAPKMSEWLLLAKQIILHRGEELLKECSEEALTFFLKQDDDNKAGRLNAFEAFRKFKGNINQMLGQEGKDE